MSKKKIFALVCLTVIILGCCLALALAIYDCYDYGNAYAFIINNGYKDGLLYFRMFIFHLFVAVLQIIIIATSAFGIWYIANSELKNIEERKTIKDKRIEQRKQAKREKLQAKLDKLN